MPYNKHSDPIAIEAMSAPLRAKQSNHPQSLLSRMARREKRPLGDLLQNFLLQ
jgi:hypothetical protein